MTTIDYKEILELEKFKAEIRNFNNNIEDRNRQYFLDSIKLACYGIVGGVFALIKTISSLK